MPSSTASCSHCSLSSSPTSSLYDTLNIWAPQKLFGGYLCSNAAFVRCWRSPQTNCFSSSQVFAHPDPAVVRTRASYFSLMFVLIGAVSFVAMFFQVCMFTHTHMHVHLRCVHCPQINSLTLEALIWFPAEGQKRRFLSCLYNKCNGIPYTATV